MTVPYAVGVKNAGTPAPPARTRSASVPCKREDTREMSNSRFEIVMILSKMVRVLTTLL